MHLPSFVFQVVLAGDVVLVEDLVEVAVVGVLEGVEPGHHAPLHGGRLPQLGQRHALQVTCNMDTVTSRPVSDV